MGADSKVLLGVVVQVAVPVARVAAALARMADTMDMNRDTCTTTNISDL